MAQNIVIYLLAILLNSSVFLFDNFVGEYETLSYLEHLKGQVAERMS